MRHSRDMAWREPLQQGPDRYRERVVVFEKKNAGTRDSAGGKLLRRRHVDNGLRSERYDKCRMTVKENELKVARPAVRNRAIVNPIRSATLRLDREKLLGRPDRDRSRYVLLQRPMRMRS